MYIHIGYTVAFDGRHCLHTKITLAEEQVTE